MMKELSDILYMRIRTHTHTHTRARISNLKNFELFVALPGNQSTRKKLQDVENMKIPHVPMERISELHVPLCCSYSISMICNVN